MANELTKKKPTRRTRRERERDLARISKYFIRGYTQAQIGEIIGRSQQQIGYDLRQMMKRWRAEYILNMDELVQRELVKIDNLEATYWEAWDRSIQEKKTKSQGKSQDSDGFRNTAQLRTEEMLGNPAYLEGVRWCIKRRCELLGLDQPGKMYNINEHGGGAQALEVVFVDGDEDNGSETESHDTKEI